MYQNFISLTFDLSFLLKFSGDGLLINEIISTKFHKIIPPFKSQNKGHKGKLGKMGNGEEPTPYPVPTVITIAIAVATTTWMSILPSLLP